MARLSVVRESKVLLQYLFLLAFFLSSPATAQNNSPKREPNITYISHDQVKDIGSTASLNCTILDGETPSQYTVLWTKKNPALQVVSIIAVNDKLIVGNSRFSVRASKDSQIATTTYKLQIRNIQEKDAGVYECSISGPYQDAQAPISKEVTLKVRVPDINTLSLEVNHTDASSDYNEYRKHSIEQLSGPIPDSDMSEYNFDPEIIERLLIERALAQFTPPAQYQEELKQLVKIYRTGLGKNGLVESLEKKYNISTTDPQTPDTITFMRLALLFPEYFRFDLASPDLTVQRCSSFNVFLPEIMKYPEFAGFLPSVGGGLELSVRSRLGRLHLYWRFCNLSKFTAEEMRREAEKVRSRMVASRLPDALRVEFLHKKGILLPDNTLPHYLLRDMDVPLEVKEVVDTIK